MPRARHCARTLSTTGMPHSGCTSRSTTTPHRAQVFALPTMLWSRQVTEVVGHIMGVRKPWRRHVAPRMTPGTVQRALLDGPKGRQCDADGNSNKIPLEAGGCQGAERGARRSCKVAWQPRRCPGVVPGLLGCSHAQARLHYQPRPRCVRAQFAPSSELSLHCACCARRQRQSSAAVASIGGAGHCKTLTLPLAPSDLIGHFEFE